MTKPKKLHIIVDSREQNPLTFDIKDVEIQVTEKSLYTGDYSLAGFEDEIAVERKSVDDLVGCVTKDRERFERELVRLRGYPTKMLIIESNWKSIERGLYRSKTKPLSVISTLMSWQERFDLPICMADTHERASILTARFLWNAYRHRYAKYRQLFA